MELVIVVAAAENGIIGRENTLPWKISADLKHFKSITLGHPIIMGRKTYESIGRPLPGRKTIVVTRQEGWSVAEVGSGEVLVAHSLNEALETAKKVAESMGVTRAMLVGGAQLYRQAIDQTSVIHKTEVHADVEGDASFPVLDGNVWREKQRARYDADDKNEFDYSFVELHRA